MADVLRPPRPAANRGAQNTRTQRKRSERLRPASNREQNPTREPPTRPAERQPRERGQPTERRTASNDVEVRNHFLREIDAHGPYDSIGRVQRGVDMFRSGGPTPNNFLPHLAAHAEFPHHLALPYDLSHHHPSMYQGAPLIRGFPAHDRILEKMQQTNAHNYRGRNLDD
jgi:hypothetical protein